MKNRKREIRTSGSVRDEDGQHPHLLGRRTFLQLAAGAPALPALSRIGRAQSYPTRPVRIIVGFAAAGPTDFAARLIGQWLSERFGSQFVVENRPGASGNIGTKGVVMARPDGYTFLLCDTTGTVNATLYSNLNFDFIRDIAPVAGIMQGPSVMLVNPSVPAKSVSELIAYAKANPGKVNMATSGNGTPPHIFGELFKMMAGVNLVPVAYRGGAPALVDLVDGQVQVMFSGITSSIGYIRNGKLRALAVTTATRSAALPDVPTLADFVPGYEASAWFGLGAPRNTPAEIVDKLNKEINLALVDPKMQAQLADLGAVPMPMTPAEFGKLIAADTEKWAKVIRAARIGPE
jgi:tripartite-type tricarboxylate transporter receptor subunit TctC